jgi:tyrosyl-tRNA synthetase
MSLQDGEHVWIVPLLVQANLAASSSAARRFIEQGAVRIDGIRISDVNARITINEPHLLQVGKRHYARIRPEKIIRV